MTAANLLLEAAAQAGYYGLMTRSSGPQIRGGEAAAMLRIATDPVYGPDDGFDALLAIDWQNVGRFAAEIVLGNSSLLIGDPAFDVDHEALGLRKIDLGEEWTALTGLPHRQGLSNAEVARFDLAALDRRSTRRCAA